MSTTRNLKDKNDTQVGEHQIYNMIDEELRKVEVALEESEEKFRNLAEKSSNIIFINKRGKVVYVNECSEVITGYKKEELYSPDFNFLSLVAPESMDPVKAAYEKHIRGQDVSSYEYILLTKNGEHLDAINTTKLIKYEGEPAILGVVTEIKEQKRAEDELKQYKEHLEELVEERTKQLRDTIAELEAFAYSVSHDLRAPLRGMQVFAQILLEDHANGLDADAKKYINRIAESSKYMNNMIENILSYSRLNREEIKLKSVDISNEIKDVIEQLDMKIKEKNAKISVESSIPKVLAHPTTLNKVISNLIFNAITFTAPGVKPKVKIWSEQINGYIRLCIEDNGIGIDPKYQEKIFRIFERLHGIETYPGTGIGLAIVRKGMERMGGRVGVESALGKGSRFWIVLEKVGLNNEDKN